MQSAATPPEIFPAAGGTAIALGALFIPIALSFIVSLDSEFAEARAVRWRRELTRRQTTLLAAVGARSDGEPSAPLTDRVAALEEQLLVLSNSREESIALLKEATTAVVHLREELIRSNVGKLTLAERVRVFRTGRLR